MTILCGSDLSRQACEASEVAAALARRLGTTLTLVHVIDELGAELAVHTGEDAVYDPLRQRLQVEAKRLGDHYHLVVEPKVVAGFAPRMLVELAEQSQATMIVVSSLSREQHWWSLGTVAERIAQASSVPVLVVRQAEPLLAWAEQKRPLRAMLAAEPGETSRAALECVARLRSVHRLDLLLTQVAWPMGEYYRFGISAPTPIDRLRPELEVLLVRDLKAWAGQVPGDGETRYLVRPGVGRIDAHLALLAQEEAADLLVVGTHQRSSVARLWQASISRGVLHQAHTNVLSVPRSGRPDSDQSVFSFGHVLVCSDLSEVAKRAVLAGYGLVPPGGTVHLLYVRCASDKTEPEVLADRLRALIPPGVAARDVTTQVEVVDDDSASLGICRTANRLGVDAICMATHGRGGVASLVLGSEAQAVLQRSDKPVILVPPHRPV